MSELVLAGWAVLVTVGMCVALHNWFRFRALITAYQTKRMLLLATEAELQRSIDAHRQTCIELGEKLRRFGALITAFQTMRARDGLRGRCWDTREYYAAAEVVDKLEAMLVEEGLLSAPPSWREGTTAVLDEGGQGA